MISAARAFGAACKRLGSRSSGVKSTQTAPADRAISLVGRRKQPSAIAKPPSPADACGRPVRTPATRSACAERWKAAGQARRVAAQPRNPQARRRPVSCALCTDAHRLARLRWLRRLRDAHARPPLQRAEKWPLRLQGFKATALEGGGVGGVVSPSPGFLLPEKGLLYRPSRPSFGARR